MLIRIGYMLTYTGTPGQPSPEALVFRFGEIPGGVVRDEWRAHPLHNAEVFWRVGQR